ncbi:hypothetical protein SAMN05421810_11473 [Amycolatopsis arida]|uniref:HTH cro/C1-type domain-containing protein n=2 Tax=Amycolatopsis arida TaxID=587909 RepID=A0A1I6ASN7_9PSEU|nr:hypothetical protein CLV69_102654 [Amycolatopsis arida]SFQ71674.1 hypothetical protein SAMN05421810_11473 [Amycolatopsis arida]
MGWDKSTLSRIETGKRNMSYEEAVQLIGLYKVSGDRRDRLLNMARTMHEAGWWEQGLRGLPADTSSLADYESEAKRITNWAPLMIPGLLQTMEYGRTWMLADGLDPEDVEVRLTARLRRQHILTGDVQYAAFIGEPALHAEVGGLQVLSTQLGALLDMAQRPNVTIRVVPSRVGAHRGQLGGFLALEFDEFSPVVHVELVRSGVFLDDTTLTDPYMEALTHLSRVAMGETESLRTITATKGEVDSRWTS